MNDFIDESTALRKLQLETVTILKAFKEYCAKHGLTWFLLSGTALGAMRHDGFIPWDDDLDVGMLREDYEKLIACAKTDFPNGFRLDVPGEHPRLATMFAKMCMVGTEFVTQETIEAGYDQGIFIDIIPLDRVALDSSVRKKQLRNSFIWQSLSYLWHSGTIVVPHKGIVGAMEKMGCRVAHHLVHLCFSPQRIYSNYMRSVMTEDMAEEWMLLSWPHTKPFPTQVLVPVSQHEFESESMPVPGNPLRYLELMYGNWREIPPVEKRHTHMPLKLKFSDGAVWRRL